MTTTTSSLLSPSQFPQSLTSPSSHCLVTLTYTPLDLPSASRFIRSPTAGANILFLGTTRNNFDNRPVSHLSYQAYPKLALQTLLKIASEVREKHKLEKVVIVHRLGEVPIEEESIIVGVSAGHRGEAWKGAEEMLERVKERAEIWKMELYGDGEGEGQVWKANRDMDSSGLPVGNGQNGEGGT